MQRYRFQVKTTNLWSFFNVLLKDELRCFAKWVVKENIPYCLSNVQSLFQMTSLSSILSPNDKGFERRDSAYESGYLSLFNVRDRHTQNCLLLYLQSIFMPFAQFVVPSVLNFIIAIFAHMNMRRRRSFVSSKQFTSLWNIMTKHKE